MVSTTISRTVPSGLGRSGGAWRSAAILALGVGSAFVGVGVGVASAA